MDQKLLKDLPFYSWECLTILMNDDQAINLVIKDQHDMTKLLEFLIVSLKTVDGFRNTALHLRDEAYLQIFKRFNLMRSRMKISFMALQKLLPVKEFFMARARGGCGLRSAGERALGIAQLHFDQEIIIIKTNIN